MRRPLTVSIVICSLAFAGLAAAERKATTQVQKTFVWKTTAANGAPLPSLFWLPSGKQGKQITKSWELRNGVKVTETRGLDENGQRLYTKRVVTGKDGVRNTLFVAAPSKTTGIIGNSTFEPQMVALGASISDSFATKKQVHQARSKHVGDERVTVQRSASSLQDLLAKPYGKPTRQAKTAPVGYKGGGPLAPLPIYE